MGSNNKGAVAPGDYLPRRFGVNSDHRLPIWSAKIMSRAVVRRLEFILAPISMLAVANGGGLKDAITFRKAESLRPRWSRPQEFRHGTRL